MFSRTSYLPDLERRVEASLIAEPPGSVVFALVRRYLHRDLAEGLWFTISPHGATLRRSTYLPDGQDPPPVRDYADPEEASQLRQLLASLDTAAANSTPRHWQAEAVLGSAEGLRQYHLSDSSTQAGLIDRLFDRLPEPVSRSG